MDAHPGLVLQGSEPSYLDRTEQLHKVMCGTMEKVGRAVDGVMLWWAGRVWMQHGADGWDIGQGRGRGHGVWSSGCEGPRGPITC